jgi:hypothetical protein
MTKLIHGLSSNKQSLPTPNELTDSEITEQLTPLAAIQGKYALIRLSGTLYVLDRQASAETTGKGCAQKFQPLKRTDATLLIIRHIKKNFPEANASKVVEEFFVSPQTHCYLGLEFNPKGSSDDVLNLWVAPSINPAEGECSKIKNFIKYVICNGNNDHYNYLMRYLSHALQRPWEKPGVMIILLGEQGVGKGTLARILQEIWRATYLQVHQIKSITGEFNASLERAFIVWLDEAFFEKNRSATDSMKSLVTESVIHINEKHQPSRQIESYHRFFGASNADFYKTTDRDDRRDFVLRVSEAYKGDHDYWAALYNEIENGGIEAIMYALTRANLTKFNVRNKPHTNELMRQKLKSLDEIDQWWHNCLAQGEIYDREGWPEFLSTEGALQAIVEFNSCKSSRKPSWLSLTNRLKKLSPSSIHKQMPTARARLRGFALPDLDVARREFSSYMCGEIDW